MTHRVLTIAATATLGLALLCAAASAQEQQLRTVARTGLFTLYPGRAARLHLVQLAGPPTLPTQVTLRLLDDRGRQVGRVDGELRVGGTLRLVVRNPPSGNRGGVPIRAEATLRTPATNVGTMPVMTLELVDERTLDVIPAASCPIAFDPRPQSGPVGYCGCELVSDFVS
jgi:hypothetical protein